MIYEIAKLIGQNCITLRDGQKIYDLIYPILKENTLIELDFKDVRIVASPFLNAAIGQLLKDMSPDDLNKNLKIINLSSTTRPVLKRVIENAKAYYTDENIREVVDQTISNAVIGEGNAD